MAEITTRCRCGLCRIPSALYNFLEASPFANCSWPSWPYMKLWVLLYWDGPIKNCIRQPSRNTYLVVHILPLKLMDTYHTTHAHREFKTSNKLLQLRFRSDLPIADWKSTLNFLFLSTSRMVKMPLPKTAHCVSLIRLISCTSTKPWVFFTFPMPPSWPENIKKKCQYWMQ